MTSTIPANATGSQPGPTRLWIALVLGVFVLPLLCVLGVSSYFRLSSDTKALRRSIISSVGPCDTRVAVRIGSLTTGLLRGCSRLVKLPAEPRAVIDAVRAVEVGVYELQREPRPADHGAVLAAADKTMTAHGWDRIVGVLDGGECVAVYIPRKAFPVQRTSCCVVVMSDRNVVMVTGHVNVEPLMELLSKHVKEKMSVAAGS